MKGLLLPAARIPSILAWLLERPTLEFAARVALASPFFISGFMKLFDYQGAMAEVTGLSLKPAVFFAAAIILTQLGGAALFMTRRLCWLGAGILSVFTVIATLLAHPFWLSPAMERGHQVATFFEHVAIVGGFIAAAMLAHQRSKLASKKQMPSDP
jgi:transmembrane protein